MEKVVVSGSLLDVAQKFRELHAILTSVREYFLEDEETRLYTQSSLIINELQEYINAWRDKCEELKLLIQQNSTITKDPEMKKLVFHVEANVLEERIRQTIQNNEEKRARLLKGRKRASDGNIKIDELQSGIAPFPNQFILATREIIHNYPVDITTLAQASLRDALVTQKQQRLQQFINESIPPLPSLPPLPPRPILSNNILLQQGQGLCMPPYTIQKHRQRTPSKPRGGIVKSVLNRQSFQGITSTASHGNSISDAILIDDDDDIMLVDRATYEKAAQKNSVLPSQTMGTSSEDLQNEIGNNYDKEDSMSSIEENLLENDNISDDEGMFYRGFSEEIQKCIENQSARVGGIFINTTPLSTNFSLGPTHILVEDLDLLKERTLERLSKSFTFEIKPNFNNIFQELRKEQMLFSHLINVNLKGKKPVNAEPTQYIGYIPTWCRDLPASHNLYLVHKHFDDEETRKLLQAMDELLKQGISTLDWSQICACLPHRSAEECKAFFWDMLEEYERSKLSKSLSVGTPLMLPQKTSIFQELAEGLKPRSIIPIREHTLRNLHMLTEITESSGDTIELSFNKDNTKLVIASLTVNEEQNNRRGNLILADLQRGVIRYLEGHRVGSMHSTVTNAKFGGYNEFIVSASLDKTVKLWSTDGSPRHTLRNKHNDVVNQLAIKQDNDSLVGASGSVDGLFVLWRVNPMGSKVFLQANWEVLNRSRSISTVKFGIDTSKETIFTGMEGKNQQGEGLLKAWDIETQVERSKYVVRKSVADFAITSTGDLCVCGTTYGERDFEKRGDCQLSLFESRNGYFRFVMGFKHDQKDTNVVTISPCGRFFTTSGTNNSTWIFDIRSNIKPLHILNHVNDKRLQTTLVEDDGVNGAQWASSSNLIFTGGSDSMVHLWDIALADPLVATYKQPGPVCSLKLSEDNSTLAVGTAGGVTRLYGNGVLWRDLSTWRIESYIPDEKVWKTDNEGF